MGGKKWISSFLMLTVFMCVRMMTSAESTDPGIYVASEAEMAKPMELQQAAGEVLTAEDFYDGTYLVDVQSSSSMFTIIKCLLTVKDGEMSAEITLKGDGYLKLFMGTGEEAVASPEKEYITYTLDEDGRQVYEIPVEAVNQEFRCTSWSRRKEKWYDRTLLISSDDIPMEAFVETTLVTADDLELPDGTYLVDVLLEGGSGKTKVVSPTAIVIENGEITANIEICSPHYDYVIVQNEKYARISAEGNSVFEIPVAGFDWKLSFIANSIAMGSPHEIDYTLYFDSLSLTEIQ